MAKSQQSHRKILMFVVYFFTAIPGFAAFALIPGSTPYVGIYFVCIVFLMAFIYPRVVKDSPQAQQGASSSEEQDNTDA